MTGPGRIVAIIPARGGSKRIPRKNLVDVGGMPLIGWTIRAALGSSWLAPSSVYVSTDDPEIAAVAEAMGAIALVRPAELATDDAWTEPVIQHAVLVIEASGIPVDVVAWMNPCVPQLTSADIDHAIAMLNEHALREVVAVDSVGRSHSAVRVLRRETLFQGRLSVKFGVLTLPYRDVNTVEDLAAVRSLLPERGQSPGRGNVVEARIAGADAPRPRVLFSAPFAFMPPALFADCPFDVVHREIWHEEQLTPDEKAVGWITNTGWSFQLGLPHLHLFPQVRVVITPSTGSDHIRVDDLRAQGLTCQSLLDDRPGLEHIAASAEHAFLLLLNGLRKLPVATAAFSRRLWRRNLEEELRGRELQGRHVGLVGFGRIGRRLARYCGAFGAEVSFCDPHVSVTEGAAVRVDRLDQLFAASDSVVICCTYNAQTEGLIGADLLRLLRTGATFVNIARGEIVDEYALAAFIQERPDVQVSLDVLAGESQARQFGSPIVPFVDHNRVVVTPHIGGSSIESQSKAARLALRLMARALGLPDLSRQF